LLTLTALHLFFKLCSPAIRFLQFGRRLLFIFEGSIQCLLRCLQFLLPRLLQLGLLLSRARKFFLKLGHPTLYALKLRLRLLRVCFGLFECLSCCIEFLLALLQNLELLTLTALHLFFKLCSPAIRFLQFGLGLSFFVCRLVQCLPSFVKFVVKLLLLPLLFQTVGLELFRPALGLF